MVTQLSQPKRTNFHILPCIGYFQERFATQFSVVFQLEERFVKDSESTLISLYSSIKRVSLGERVRLAYEIAVAVGNLHRVGWLHKELKSENILFFKILPRGGIEESTSPAFKSSPSINFGLPWLFGFEYSRQEDANTYLESDYSPENNAYRHPERWGKPMVKFERSHDVYSLVRFSSSLSGSLLTVVIRGL
jgi:serine/threonine protein kinase